MSKTKAKPKPPPARRATLNVSAAREEPLRERLLPWLTHAAFVLAIALVTARCTVLESLRDPVDPRPGLEIAPRGPGVTASLVLDLLCCVPALLVLVRRVLERAYLLRWSWSHVLFGLLALWAVLSPLWATNKFDAAVSAPHLLAAA